MGRGSMCQDNASGKLQTCRVELTTKISFLGLFVRFSFPAGQVSMAATVKLAGKPLLVLLRQLVAVRQLRVFLTV